MVRRTPDPDDRGAPPSAEIAVEALDHLVRLDGLMAYLLERRGGYPSPLEARIASAGRWANPAAGLLWDRLVGTISVTASVLESILREAGEEGPMQADLYFLTRWLQEGESELLRDVRGLWQGARARLRPHLVARARLDAATDLAPTERAVRACTACLSPDGDGQRLKDALHGVLSGLLLHAGTARTREVLRGALRDAAAMRAPRKARHAVARALVDGLVGGDGPSIEQLVGLDDPARVAPPPAERAHALILLLAVLDVVEARGAPGLLQRMRSAYSLLGKLAQTTAMAPQLHEAVDAVISASLDGAAVPGVVRLALQATAGFASRHEGAAPPSTPDGLPGDAQDSQLRSQGPPSAQGEVSSPPTTDLRPTPGHGSGCAHVGSPPGDETQVPPSPDSSAPGGGSSPRAPAGDTSPGQVVRNASTGGDGTETSAAPFSAAAGEVSSPATSASQAPRPRPQDLAIAYLVRALRTTGVVPSKAECARAAGAKRQATAKWPAFLLSWDNARKVRGGHLRRGYRNARTGDIEAESDDS